MLVLILLVAIWIGATVGIALGVIYPMLKKDPTIKQPMLYSFLMSGMLAIISASYTSQL